MAIPIEVVPYNPAWPQFFAVEHERLLQTLGWYRQGGVVFGIEHIGSTSVPGLAAKPCIDIAIAVVPFPLNKTLVMAIEALEYQYRGENGIAGRQYFQRGPHDFHLHVFEAGDWRFDNHVVFRNYLRANDGALHRYQSHKQNLAAQHRDNREAYIDGKAPLITQLLQEAHTWHVEKTGWKPVELVAKELESLTVPWWVSSGWALDLHIGQPQRLHQDFDVVIWREDQQAVLGHLEKQSWELNVPINGKYHGWVKGEYFQLSQTTQVHCYQEGTPFDFLDILFSERQGNQWVWRRDQRIRMLTEQIGLNSQSGIPYLNPAIVLLFKSKFQGKEPRAKDQQDIERTLPYLSQEQKGWMRDALATWAPEHPWQSLM